MNDPFEHCPQCKHYDEDQSEYHYCHVCVMDHDCYQKKEDSEQKATKNLNGDKNDANFTSGVS